MKPKSSDFRSLLKGLSHRHDSRRVFDAFLCLAACALAAGTREAEYLAEAKLWNQSELQAFSEALGALVAEMESRPFEDILGGYYLDAAVSQKGQQWNGEFHTPKTVCDLMARMLVNPADLPPEGPITVCEPACGAGAMILSLAQVCPPEVRRRLRVTAIDISRTACHMAFINTTLWGIPTRIIHGNALSLECWAAWSNLHWIAPWLPLALRPRTPEASEQGQPPPPAEVERLKGALVQPELTFG